MLLFRYKNQAKKKKNLDYIDVAVSGWLMPVRYFIKEKIGVYVELNVWTIHELKECRDHYDRRERAL